MDHLRTEKSLVNKSLNVDVTNTFSWLKEERFSHDSFIIFNRRGPRTSFPVVGCRPEEFVRQPAQPAGTGAAVGGVPGPAHHPHLRGQAVLQPGVPQPDPRRRGAAAGLAGCPVPHGLGWVQRRAPRGRGRARFAHACEMRDASLKGKTGAYKLMEAETRFEGLKIITRN